MVRCEDLFIIEELKRAGGKLKASSALWIDGVPNEMLKEVIGAYPEILLEAFNSCLRDGRFFADWKEQRLVLLRKGNKPLEDASSLTYWSIRPICLVNTMIDDHLSGRWVIYEGDKWSLKEQITYGGPQGSRVGPLVWNIMYDDFLRMDLPAGTSIMGFVDDALVVCAADDVGIVELRIN